MWILELSWYVMHPNSVISISEIVRLTGAVTMYQVIIVFSTANRFRLIKLFNGFVKFDNAFMAYFKQAIPDRRFEIIFLHQLCLWSVHYILVAPLTDQFTCFPITDYEVALWFLVYAIIGISSGLICFFLIYCKRQIDLRLTVVLELINEVVSKKRLCSEIYLINVLLCDLQKMYDLFNKLFGTLLVYLFIIDSVYMIGNFYFLVNAILHMKKQVRCNVIDFALYIGPVFIRVFYLYNNINKHNSMQVKYKYLFPFRY